MTMHTVKLVISTVMVALCSFIAMVSVINSKWDEATFFLVLSIFYCWIQER